ncbi:TadE/TadG family type IV pilus assembly protein [Lentzea nigeriaca]|uniref:TadE/TadG family type IV pilus assembly protein n=1 Tax=Lentzea nigeriaca TaxID=1128665 RepID=UPI00195A0CEE|nr:TadE/TadG family type IV pilus assembly protein [Lentzea nigeriaca]MBM7861663.1 Flp pilus assembly protein TadG [Lentzea nigeriaca]
MRTDDRGALGVLIAILLGFGVLLGMGAIVIDVGSIYQERAELQNGADAGALAVAQGCAKGKSTCLPNGANPYANNNAKDDVSAVDKVCGSDGFGVLSSCSASTGAITDCPAKPASGTKYVDVHTSTQTSGGGTLLPPWFARTLAGNGSYDGTQVKACSRAAWGPPKTATTIALTISWCEWSTATSGGTVFGPTPPTTPPLSAHRVLKLHTTSGTGCPGGPSGSDGPGEFGWVDEADNDCSVLINNNTYSSDTGASAGKDCKTALQASWSSRTPVWLPIYTNVAGTGTGGTYTLSGFAGFVITGYWLPGASQKDWLTGKNECTGSDKCIAGYFVQGLIPSTGTIGGPDLGARIVQLTG